MRLAFLVLLVLHGLIHLLGFAKAFQLADLPQLTRPIAPAIGVLWLAATVLFLLTAAALVLWPRWWWAIGGAAVAVSMIAIVPSWEDAKFGALANLVVLAGVVLGFFMQGPASLRAAYEEDVHQRLTAATFTDTVTEANLAHLPEQVRRYLRASGAIGQPQVHNFRVRMHGRIRNGPDSPWMPFTAEQHNFLENPARFFYMDASLLLVPLQGLHRYADGAAGMRIKALGLVPVLDVSGPEMTQAETVTLFNDMCIMAPASLIDPDIRWEALDTDSVRATFGNGAYTIRAELSFNAAGELVDFWSGDRRRSSGEGRMMIAVPWSTPLRDYRAFGTARLASRGDGRWHEPTGQYAYIEVWLDDVQYNVSGR